MKMLILLIMGLFCSVASADIMQDFDSLGGNDQLLEKAQALRPETRIEVVQDRIVDRRNRLEISPEFTSVLGGDAYLETYTSGLNVQYHITPRWSIGANYGYANNYRTDELNDLIGFKDKNNQAVPEMDWMKQSYQATVNWYPMYGKFNLYDLGIVHFDVYAIGGIGEVELRSGKTSTWSTGGGIGLWWSQHLTTRLEMRYQTYTSKRFDGSTDMELTVASLAIGYML